MIRGVYRDGKIFLSDPAPREWTDGQAVGFEPTRLGPLPPYPRREDVALRERFAQLAQRWREETRWLSSTTEAAMHPAYQAVIGMGWDALPLILEELRADSGHWFWALKAITGEDPVSEADRGSIQRMRDAWLQWGRAKGLLAA